MVLYVEEKWEDLPYGIYSSASEMCFNKTTDFSNLITITLDTRICLKYLNLKVELSQTISTEYNKHQTANRLWADLTRVTVCFFKSLGVWVCVCG